MHTDLNPLADVPPPLPPKPYELRLGETLDIFADGTRVNLQVKSEDDKVLHNFHLVPMEAKEVMVALGISIPDAESNEWDHYDAGDAPSPDVLLDLGAGR